MVNAGLSFLRNGKKKLKKQSGTTLVETLAAFLIVVFMLGMLARTMVMTADLNMKTNQIRRSNESAIEAYWQWKAGGGSGAAETMNLTDKNYGVVLPGYLHVIDLGGSAKVYDFSVK